MKRKKLPPGQHQIKHILRWNIDHLGITSKNPQIDIGKWVLTVEGEVQNPVKLTWSNFLKLPSVELQSDFHCVEGWSVVDCRWHGVKFNTLVEIVKPVSDAKYALFRCFDGYTTSLSLMELLEDNVLLAYKLNSKYLEGPLGGPLRLIVPDKYAYKSAMWINKITFTKRRQLGYWEKRGYSNIADVRKNDRFAL